MSNSFRRRLWYPDSDPVTRSNIGWAAGRPGGEPVEPKPLRRRPRAKQSKRKFATAQAVEAIACLAVLWEMAEQLEDDIYDPRPRSGRKRLFTVFEALLFEAVALQVGYCGAERMLGDLKFWNRLRRAVRKHYRHNRRRRLTKRPINRSQHYRFARKHLSHTVIDEFQATMTKTCIEAVVALGGLDPEAGSVTHPDTTQMLVGDGTDLRFPHQGQPNVCRYHDPDDPDHRCNDKNTPCYARLRENTDTPAFTAIKVLWRTPNPRERILVDFDLRTPGRSDGSIFVDRIENLITTHRKRLVGFRGTVYDMAIKGRDHERLMQRGLTHIGKVPREPGKVAEHTLGDFRFRLPKKHNGNTHEELMVIAIDGAPAIEVPGDDNKIRYLPLKRSKVELRRRKDGCTIYTTWLAPDNAAVPEHLRGASSLIRHNRTWDELDLADENRRAAALRLIPESDNDHDWLFGLREDPESSNRHLKYILRGQARSADSRRLRMCLLGYQMLLLVTTLHERLRTDPHFDMSGFFSEAAPRANPP